MYEDLIKQAREFCKPEPSRSEDEVMGIAYSIISTLSDALEAAQKENKRLRERVDGERRKFIPWMNAAEKFRKERDKAITRAEKAEAERDAYRKELSHLEHMVSHERSMDGKREHSVGVVVAVHRARELLKGE